MQNIINLEWSIGLLYDVAAAVLLFIVAMSYCRKGFFAGLLNLVGTIGSIIGGSWAAKTLTPIVFDKVFGGTILQEITDALNQHEVSAAEALEEYAGFLPRSVQEAILEKLDVAVNASAPEVAKRILQEIVEPLVSPILSALLFFVALILIHLVLLLISNLFVGVNRVPVVGTVNQVFGCVLGVVAGVADIFLLMCLLWLVTIITNNDLPWLNQEILAGSKCFELFEKVNPFI